MSECSRFETDNETLSSDSLTSVTSISDVSLSEFLNDTIQRATTTARANVYNSQTISGCDGQGKSFVEETNFESDDVIDAAINQLRRDVHKDTDDSVKKAILELRQIIHQEKAKYTKMKEVLGRMEMEKRREIETSRMLSKESLQSCIKLRGLFFELHTIDLNLAMRETEIIMMSPRPSSPVSEADNDNKSVHTIARGLKVSIRRYFQCCTNPCAEREMEENFVLDYDSD